MTTPIKRGHFLVEKCIYTKLFMFFLHISKNKIKFAAK